MNKIEESLYEQAITELINYLITFTNFLNLNDKKITKLEQQYHDFKLWFNQESKEVAN